MLSTLKHMLILIKSKHNTNYKNNTEKMNWECTEVTREKCNANIIIKNSSKLK